MIDLAVTLVPFAQDTLRLAFLTFLRIGAAAALLPAFGEQLVPMRLRLAVAIAFSLIVLPVAGPVLAQALETATIWRVGLIEVVAGLVMGIGLRLFVHTLQIAGSIAAQSTSLSQILGNAAVEPMPAMGHVLLIGGLALAVMLGLHLRLAEYLILSYDLFPPAVTPDAAMLANWGIARAARAFSLAFSLAAPFVIASFVYNLALGVINRAMPQLMVAFVGAPAITAGGLILLLLTAPLILQVWSQALFAFIAAPGAGL